ncbi:MAG: hypothetical protein ACOZCO_06585 [Bacteroidota bacterium]
MISLLSKFTKKKISEEKLAGAFVGNLIQTVQDGFPEVAALINEDPEFVKCPNIHAHDDEQFLMIVLVGNLKLLPESFEPELEEVLKSHIIDRCASAFGVEKEEFTARVKEYNDFLSRVNHPSKNVLYSMSKGVFYKYNLNHYQADYFRTLNTPNPIFLKRMNEVLNNFIWNWEAFFDRYKVVL